MKLETVLGLFSKSVSIDPCILSIVHAVQAHAMLLLGSLLSGGPDLQLQGTNNSLQLLHQPAGPSAFCQCQHHEICCYPYG